MLQIQHMLIIAPNSKRSIFLSSALLIISIALSLGRDNRINYQDYHDNDGAYRKGTMRIDIVTGVPRSIYNIEFKTHTKLKAINDPRKIADNFIISHHDIMKLDSDEYSRMDLFKASGENY